jgi:hypothetical protein
VKHGAKRFIDTFVLAQRFNRFLQVDRIPQPDSCHDLPHVLAS